MFTNLEADQAPMSGENEGQGDLLTEKQFLLLSSVSLLLCFLIL